MGADPRTSEGVTPAPKPIVVGVDGSEGSVAALRWALAEARLRGAPLTVVHAYQLPQLSMADVSVGGPAVGMPTVPSEDVERLRSASEAEGRRIIDQTLERVDGEATAQLKIERKVVEGPPASALIEEGRSADLLVLASRGRGGFVGLLLGSVSQQIAHHPPCPVVILPPVEEPG